MSAADFPRFLRALADHYDAHPGLPAVTVHGWKYDRRVDGYLFDLQLHDVHDHVPGLVAWAESLGTAAFTVIRGGGPGGGWCHLNAHGTLDGQPLHAWNAVPRLTGSDLPDGSLLPVADLAAAVERDGDLAEALAQVQAECASGAS